MHIFISLGLTKIHLDFIKRLLGIKRTNLYLYIFNIYIYKYIIYIYALQIF
jgi:hypothetical protein